MSLFQDLQVENDIAVVEDKVGGGFAKIETTGLYNFTIEKAFAGQSDSGAYSVTIHLKADNGAKLQITEYITSGSAKGCKNYYLDKTGAKQFLPGYNKIKNLDALIGYDRNYPKTTKGQIMLWDYDSKAELPVEKEVITEWIGKKVSALIIKRLEDKYSNPLQAVTKYEVEHFLDSKTSQTRNEKVAGLFGFSDKWLSKHPSTFVSDKRVQSKNASTEVATSTGNASIDVATDDSPFDF